MTDPMHPMPARPMPTISTFRRWMGVAAQIGVFLAVWALAVFIACGITLGLIALLIKYPGFLAWIEKV